MLAKRTEISQSQIHHALPYGKMVWDHPGMSNVGRFRWSIATAVIAWLVANQGSRSNASEPELPQVPRANVFVPSLPECSSIRNPKPVRKATERLLGKKVSLRGLLTFGAHWVCTCACVSDWRVVDAKADVFKGPAPAVLIKRLEQTSRWERWQISARAPFPIPPDLDVVATGILRRTNQGSTYYDDFLLEDAELCRMPADPHPHKPLVHPPSTVSNLDRKSVV